MRRGLVRKKCDKGLVASGRCLACGAPRETHGHRWYGCSALLDSSRHPQEPPAAICRTRERLGQLALETAQEDPYEALPLAYVIPLKLPPAETPPMCPDFVYQRGGSAVPRGGRLYIDGGGFAMDVL